MVQCNINTLVDRVGWKNYQVGIRDGRSEKRYDQGGERRNWSGKIELEKWATIPGTVGSPPLMRASGLAFYYQDESGRQSGGRMRKQKAGEEERNDEDEYDTDGYCDSYSYVDGVDVLLSGW